MVISYKLSSSLLGISSLLIIFSPIKAKKKLPSEIIVSIIPTMMPLCSLNHSYEFVVDGYNIIPVPIPPKIIAKISKNKFLDKYIIKYPKLKRETPIKLVKCNPISLYIIPLIKAEIH